MPERLVVIGGDAGGMTAAVQARRRRSDLEIVALEQGRWTSYSACGIPYVVGGDVQNLDSLVARAPQAFRDDLFIDVRTEHEVLAVDLAARSVEVRDLRHDRTYRLSFDMLHLATGATPVRPKLAGIDLGHVHGVQTLEDAADLLGHASAEEAMRVAVIGGGYIGLELAEAFLKRGRDVTVIDRAGEVMGGLDPDMGALVAEAMRRHGITVHSGEAVLGIEAGTVVTEGRRVPADLVILGLGVQPNSQLAEAAGITTGVRGAIKVDPQQQTSAEGVWSAGDCCESFHLVSRRPVHMALGTVANKQGRVAGINMGGGYASFSGVLGTAVTKLCSLEIGRTGLNEREAIEAGLGFVAATVESTTTAGYFRDAAPVTVKLLGERSSGRILGGQVVGQTPSAKRIDVIATAITAGMTVDELAVLDLSYGPPFTPLWDPFQIAARKVGEQL